jgi:SagB-type dehydrogenase family enzyme
MKTNRQWLKSDRWDEWAKDETDQKKKLPVPPVQLDPPEGAELFDLVAPDDFKIGKTTVIDAIRNRKSRRRFLDEPLSLEELSFLLWATQGVREVMQDGKFTRRTVPSGGSRHPFETYIVLNRVKDFSPGLYRYLPMDHKLCRLVDQDEMIRRVENEEYGAFFLHPAVVFVWTVIPYRCEWRYSMISDKIIALDGGHVCQNLYTACEALGLGTCAYDGYDQDTVDKILQVDGEDEFTLYLATVGKVKGE